MLTTTVIERELNMEQGARSSAIGTGFEMSVVEPYPINPSSIDHQAGKTPNTKLYSKYLHHPSLQPISSHCQGGGHRENKNYGMNPYKSSLPDLPQEPTSELKSGYTEMGKAYAINEEINSASGEASVKELSSCTSGSMMGMGGFTNHGDV